MIPSQESEQNRRKNKSGDYEVTPQDLQNLTLVAQWCRMLHDVSAERAELQHTFREIPPRFQQS